jgi:hypothetical protein
MVFNITFSNNISAISWQSVLLVEETRVPGEQLTCCKSLTNFYHIKLYRAHLAMSKDRTHNFSSKSTIRSRLPL